MMEKQVMMKKQMEMFQMKQNMMKQAQVQISISNLQMTILKVIYCTFYNLGSCELCHVWSTQQLDGKSLLQFIYKKYLTENLKNPHVNFCNLKICFFEWRANQNAASA